VALPDPGGDGPTGRGGVVEFLLILALSYYIMLGLAQYLPADPLPDPTPTITMRCMRRPESWTAPSGDSCEGSS